MINVNRQYAHKGGKMRGVIQSSLRQSGHHLAPLTAMPFVPPQPEAGPGSYSLRPSMLSAFPHELPPVEVPRNTVQMFNFGERVAVVSFDENGEEYERYEGPRSMVTDSKLQVMADNLASKGTPTLHLL